jgi:transcriptional regulator of acetoin/glycerol metabolism
MEHPTTPHPMRIAIVDDDPIACREIARGLSRRAAQTLKLPRTILWRKMKKYRLE